MVTVMKQAICLSLCMWFNMVFNIHCSETSGELDFYSFTVMDIYENIVSLEEYRGKVSLVVNVASQCGYTDKHYKSFVRLQELLEDTNRFNVLAFPCNQFGQQEPGSNMDVLDFAIETYGANFPMFAKVNVKGPDALDAWKYLSEKSGHEPEWNFWKYLVDSNGQVVNAWGPWTDPDKLYNIITLTIRKAEKAEKEKKEKAEKEKKEKAEREKKEKAEQEEKEKAEQEEKAKKEKVEKEKEKERKAEKEKVEEKKEKTEGKEKKEQKGEKEKKEKAEGEKKEHKAEEGKKRDEASRDEL